MPKTRRKKAPRKTVRLPLPMIEEIDRIVDHHVGLHYSRQSFIESAIREKIEKMKLIETEKT